MVSQRSRADLVYAALEGAERTWRLGDAEIQITQLAWDDAKNRVTADARVLYQGEFIADDRWHFVNPPLLTGDGTYTTFRRYISPDDGQVWLSDAQLAALPRVTQRSLVRTDDTQQRENMAYQPRLALMRALVHTASVATKGWTQPRFERIGMTDKFRGDTLTAYGTEDGYLISWHNTNISTARSGSNLSATTTNPNRIESSSGAYQFAMTCIAFDTSSLTSATVSAAVLSLAGTGTAETNTDSPTIEARFHDYGSGNPTTADWFNIATTGWTGKTMLGTFALASWNQTADAYNAFSDSGNYGSISLTGTTRIVIGTSLFGSGTPTGSNVVQCRSSEQAGTTSDPKLVITYTPAPTGTMAATLQQVLFSGSGAQTQTGTISATLQKATAALTGGQAFAGAAAATLQAATFSGSGSQGDGVEGTVAATLRPATASLTGVMQPSGTVAATLQEPTFAGTGAQTITGSAAATMQPALASMAGTQTQTGTIAGTLQPATFAAAGKTGPSGTIAATLQKATAALAGFMQPAGTIAATMAKATFTGSGGQTFLGVIAATLRPATFAGVATQIYTGTMAATMQAARFAGVGHFDNAGAVLVSIAKSFLVRIGILKHHEVEIGAVARTYEVEIIMSNETCYVGNSVTATGRFTTVSSGTLTDPTTVTATVQTPSGTKTTYTYGVDPEMAKSSTGIYTCTYTPSSAGKWIVKFTGAGAVVAVNQEDFTVLTPI